MLVNDASKKGHVFIKWRETGDASWGGGTLISSGVADVTTGG